MLRTNNHGQTVVPRYLTRLLASDNMSINFGNIGDIIAIGEVALELAKALTGRGSRKEYQGLVKELEAFDNALLQVSYKVCRSIAWLLNRIGGRIMAEL